MRDMMEFYEQEESINIKEFVFGILGKWYWFFIFGLIGLMIAFCLTKSKAAIFQVSASVLVNDNAKGTGVDALFDGLELGSKSKVQNHVAVLKSYRIVEGALKDLNWTTSWFAEGMFKDNALYKRLPFIVIPLAGAINPSNLPIKIYPISDTKYRIVVLDGMYKPKGASSYVKISFEEEATFGQPFVNKAFGFILKKTDFYKKSDLFFKFNDLSVMTRSYQSRLSVSLMDKKADMISLSLKDNSSARAVDFLNALIDEYVSFGLGIKNRTSKNVVSFIDSQVKGIVDSLNRASDVFTSFRADNKTIDLGQEASLVVESLKEIDSRHFMAKMSLDYYNNLRLYMNDESKMKNMVTPSVVGVTDIALNALVSRLGDLYARRSVLASVARENNPSLIALDREILQVRQSLSNNLDNLVLNTSNEVKALELRKNEVARDLASLPAKEQKLINIKRDFDINNELFTFLQKRRAEAAITMASNVSDVQVIDKARTDTAVKVGPKSMINLIIGLILGMGFPFAFFVLKDFFSDSVLSRKALEKLTKLPIYGQISHSDIDEDLKVFKFPRSTIAENFRSLRTNLHYLLAEREQKVIAIHSAIPVEGKSFCAINLASIMALAGKSVLLVGCDLRKPILHDSFELENSVGLSNLLIKDASFEEVVQKSGMPNLSVVCSGPIPPNPAELLGRREFVDFLHTARDKFDVIVLDNAPMLLVTDSSVVGAFADANLFVVRHGLSKNEHVKAINTLIERGKLPNVGLIYNDVQNDHSAYSYSSYNYYGEDDTHIKRKKKKKKLWKF